jgi:hypothetical protein
MRKVRHVEESKAYHNPASDIDFIGKAKGGRTNVYDRGESCNKSTFLPPHSQRHYS